MSALRPVATTTGRAARRLAIALVLLLAAAWGARPGLADEGAPAETPEFSSTSYSFALASGDRLAFTAQAGVLPVRPAPEKPAAAIF
jgi:hypothetical protein